MGIIDEIVVEVILRWDGELQHDDDIRRKGGELGGNLLFEKALRLGPVRTMDIDLRLDNGNKPRSKDLLAELELLLNDFADSFGIRFFDDGPHFRSKDMPVNRSTEQAVQVGHGLHELNAVAWLGKSFIDLKERHDVLHLPEVVCSQHAVDGPIHCILEQNGAENVLRIERRAFNNPGSHLMNKLEHFLVIMVPFFLNAILQQRLRRAPAALVQRSNKSFAIPHPFQLFLIHTDSPLAYGRSTRLLEKPAIYLYTFVRFLSRNWPYPGDQ
ncbi:hypothetical protein D3C71_1453930 [compost metagenome]